jgi:hypothetical protein
MMKIIDIIVERRGYLLLIKMGDYWLLPGGELKDGQDEMSCLEEIVSKEMGTGLASVFKKLDKTITGTSIVRNCEVEVTVYVGDISAERMSDIKDCNAHWFSRESISSLRLSHITKDVFSYYFSLEKEASLPTTVPPSGGPLAWGAKA